jgi:peptidoglycan/LPS O-acetylase OafA/YrhL
MSQQAAAPPKLDTLEIGRFLAASAVFASHIPWFAAGFARSPQETLFGGWSAPGPFAVEYFFTLSGFVMMMAHHKDFARPGAPWRFWWRRACRIFPMYWLSLALALQVAPPPATWEGWIKILTLAPVAVPDVVLPAWSLHVEIAFYVLFGLCLVGGRLGAVILGAWLGLVTTTCCSPRLLVHILPHAFSAHEVLGIIGSPNVFFHLQFFAGLAAGWLFLNATIGRRTGWGLLGIGTLALLACLPELHWGHDYLTRALAPVLALAFGAVVLGLASLERAGVFRPGRWARWLGAASYPLYILHTSLMMVFYVHTGGTWRYGEAGLYAVFFVTLFAIWAAAFAVALLVDQPLQRGLRWASRALATKTAAHA